LLLIQVHQRLLETRDVCVAGECGIVLH